MGQAQGTPGADHSAAADSLSGLGDAFLPDDGLELLWFDTETEEAAGDYFAIFKNSRIVNVTHYTEVGPGPAGTRMTVEFERKSGRGRLLETAPPALAASGSGS